MAIATKAPENSHVRRTLGAGASQPRSGTPGSGPVHARDADGPRTGTAHTPQRTSPLQSASEEV